MGFLSKLFGGGEKKQVEGLDVVIKSKRTVGDDVVALTLARATGEPLPPFEPGAHIDVFVPGFVRQYSLCSDPSRLDTWDIGVLVEANGRGGSKALGAMAEGQALRVGYPRNHFPLVPQGAAVLMAGGIGVTPLIAMAYRLKAEGRPFEFHLFARTQGRAAFQADLPPLFGGAFHVHIDAVGQLPPIAQVLEAQSKDAHVYTCGPDGFMKAVLAAGLAAGFPEEHLHTESFTPAAPRSGDEAFEVILKKSGKTLKVGATETIAEAMERAGVASNRACGSGACGSCMQTLCEGSPDHRDQILSKKERAANKSILVCVSRAKSPKLIIDA